MTTTNLRLFACMVREHNKIDQGFRVIRILLQRLGQGSLRLAVFSL